MMLFSTTLNYSSSRQLFPRQEVSRFLRAGHLCRTSKRNLDAIDSFAAADVPESSQRVLAQGFPGLLLCSFLWGTYGPALKLIYAEEHPLDPATLTAVRGLIAAAALLSVDALSAYWQKPSATSAAAISDGAGVHCVDRSLITDTDVVKADSLQGTSGEMQDRLSSSGVPSSEDPVMSGWLVNAAWVGLAIAGLELGLYNFIATSMEAVGLQITSATRAGFITQSCAVITPALAYFMGEKLPLRTWFAVVIGLGGSCLVAYDGMDTTETASMMVQSVSASESPDEVRGALLLFASCIFYSLAVVRLGEYAPRFGSVKLAASKKVVFFVMVSVYCILFEQQNHPGLSSLPLEQQLDILGLSGRSASSWGLIAFSALGPGALATYLETSGQSTVPATQAQLIYSLAPIWSAAMAQLLYLPGEGMGPYSWAGGGAVLVASILAARSSK